MISIIDIGSGNISSFVNSYNRMGIPCEVIKTKRELQRATKLILPGVGSFDSFMNKLNLSGLKSELEKQVLENEVPILGICVGMQILGNKSDEGNLPGLGWIEGEIKHFSASHDLPVPSMGWNSVKTDGDFPLLKSADLEKGYYFLHGYYFKENEILEHRVTSHYGHDFTCGFQRKNIFGIQFHPEKSHENGSILLKNFAEVTI